MQLASFAGDMDRPIFGTGAVVMFLTLAAGCPRQPGAPPPAPVIVTTPTATPRPQPAAAPQNPGRRGEWVVEKQK